MPAHVHIVGCGKYVPERVVTNEELAKDLDTSATWIRERTGICERRIAAANESTSTMAVRAGAAALAEAKVDAADLDLIVVGTVTPDFPIPSTACLVQGALGAKRAGAFDLAAGCSGFVYGLTVVSQMIQAGAHKNALVIGADTMSRVTDWSDRSTCVLLGDGAGAFVLQASDRPGGVQACQLGADGSGASLLSIPAGGSRCPATSASVHAGQHFLKMDGREVFRFATRTFPKLARAAVDQAGWTLDSLDLIIPHQANRHIIETAARALKLPLERFFLNLDRYGNTSSASIPIAACEALDQGRLRQGNRALLLGFGAGLTWGVLTVEWSLARVCSNKDVSPARPEGLLSVA